MKKLLIVFAALTLTAGAFGQISDSAHDFSGETWNLGGEICVVCHTPHNADLTATGSPLWNHEVTTTVFDLYASSTLNAAMGQPVGVSRLCLSCHDGTVALDNFGGTTGGTNFIAARADFSDDLSDDHPISFTYNAALATADGELFDPTVANSGVGAGTIDEDMLFAGNMECASCHDVHNTYGESYLLVKSNAASALCLTCHDK